MILNNVQASIWSDMVAPITKTGSTSKGADLGNWGMSLVLNMLTLSSVQDIQINILWTAQMNTEQSFQTRKRQQGTINNVEANEHVGRGPGTKDYEASTSKGWAKGNETSRETKGNGREMERGWNSIIIPTETSLYKD